MFNPLEITSSASAFCDHGVPVQADEGRTAAICTNERGDTRLVIAARGYVLIVDPQARTSRQVYFPNDNRDYPYASLSSLRGMFYVGAGTLLMVLDPFTGQFVDCVQAGQSGEAVGFRLAEGPDGTIYAASYPTCRLLQYMPETREWNDLGRLEQREEYPFSLAVGKDGWVYAGIGTEQCIVAARNPANGETRRLLVGGASEHGRGVVQRGVDGEIYGQLVLSAAVFPQPWFRLERGEALAMPDNGTPDSSEYTGEGFDTVHRRFPAPWQLLSWSLPDKETVVRDETNDQTHTIPLVYKSEGAELSPIVAGPDNRIYGTSNHPLHLYTYDPQSNTLNDTGGRTIEKGGGGNICAYAIQGSVIAGAAYAGGHIHLIDASHPFRETPTDSRNPRLVASAADIFRPRCALAHPDGKHVVFGGFGDYGVVGGGLYIRNLADGTDQLLPAERLLPHHSTLCIVPLPGGDLLCGTSVEAPGGGKPKAAEGRLYRLDWRTKEVVYSEAPVPGAAAIELMEIDGGGRIHAFTAEGYFAYDPQARKVIRQEELVSWGGVVRQGLVKSGGGTIYGVRGQAVFRIDAEVCRPILLARPPQEITAGLALLHNRLYFASGARLWSMQL